MVNAPAPQCQPTSPAVRQIDMGTIERFKPGTDESFEPDDEALIFLNDDNEQTCHVEGHNAKAMAAQIVTAVSSHASLLAQVEALRKALDEVIRIDRMKVFAGSQQIADNDGLCAQIARAALQSPEAT